MRTLTYGLALVSAIVWLIGIAPRLPLSTEERAIVQCLGWTWLVSAAIAGWLTSITWGING